MCHAGPWAGIHKNLDPDLHQDDNTEESYKMKKRIFSGIQPSGKLHIGNYLGAVRNWAPLQKDYDCLYCVVDLHSITVYQKPEILREKIADTVRILLAAGIDPEKSIIFVQSHVKEHTELGWILNTITPISELERMTQYKEKALKQKQGVNAGLLNYPVLMAADILLYETQAVPVGEDQKQHVELARVIARKFNNLYGETFAEPQALVKKEAGRIMSLSNPLSKMSKSDGDQSGCVGLLDEPDVIREKFKKAITDSGKEIIYDPEKKPAISNLLTIYSAFSGKSVKELWAQYNDASGYAEFKMDVAQAVIAALADFQKKYQELKNDASYLEKVIRDGAQKARQIAELTIKEVKEKIGIL